MNTCRFDALLTGVYPSSAFLLLCIAAIFRVANGSFAESMHWKASFETLQQLVRRYLFAVLHSRTVIWEMSPAALLIASR